MKAWHKNYESLLNACVLTGMSSKGKNEYYLHIESEYSLWPNLVRDLYFNQEALDLLLQNLKKTSNFLLPKSRLDNKLNSYFETQKLNSGLWYEMSIKIDDRNKHQNFDRIKEVSSKEELETWVDLVEDVLLQGAKLDREGFYKLWKSENAIFILAYDNQEAVATSMFHHCDESLGLYFVVTHPNYRSKGMGTEMTAFAYQLARDLKCEYCVLQAAEMGRKVYSKFGYQVDDEVKVYSLIK